MTTFTERLPDTKSAKYRGYRFTRCEGAACRCDAKIVYEAKRVRDEYAVTEFPCDFAGRAFRVEKLGGDAYDVMIGDSPRSDTCECWGFLRYGKCRHVACLRDVLANNLLPSPLCNADADYANAE